jgi:hypothetical protein
MRALPLVQRALRAFCVVFALIMCGSSGLAASVLDWGGSNYVIFDSDPEKIHDDPAAWRDNTKFRTPFCQFEERSADVRRDLTAMQAHGQKKLAFLVWFTHFRDDQACRGFLANSAGGRLSKKVLDNLEALVRLAGELGFDEVQVRLAPMGKNWPNKWRAWDEKMYRENWGVIQSVVTRLIAIKKPRILFDLGVEAIGKGQSDAYVRRMWADYTHEFPIGTSYGFSIAMAPGRVTRLLDDLRSSAKLPDQIAIDVYGNAGRAVAEAAREMRAAGVNLPILIQETFYADDATYKALQEAARDNGVEIRAVMQWPKRAGQRPQISESKTYRYIYAPRP